MGRWVQIAGSFRAIVRKEIGNSGEREELYRRFLSAGPPPEDNPPPVSTHLTDWLVWIDSLRTSVSKRKL
jgi:hypothetical protein